MIYGKVFWDSITRSGLSSTISINNQEIPPGVPPKPVLKNKHIPQSKFSSQMINSLSSESQLKLKANFHIMETCYNSRSLENRQQGNFLVMELFCFLLRLTIVPHWGEKLDEQIVDVCSLWNKSGEELCALFVYTSHGPASSFWTVLPCPHSLWCNLKWMKENWSSSACQNTSGDTGLVAEICLWNWLNRDL